MKAAFHGYLEIGINLIYAQGVSQEPKVDLTHEKCKEWIEQNSPV